MLPKLLIISGPTATGKTSLAAKFARKYHGELISADSRQVYRGLDIGTGKDHPKNIPIHLLDLFDPDSIFSVAQFQLLARQKITEVQSRGHLPIIVGGTGLYIRSLTHPHYSTFLVKPHRPLRFILNRLPVSILQKILILINRQLFDSLNSSDRRNPHRLIRKIELSLNHKLLLSSPFLQRGKEGDLDFSILHLSLTAPYPYLFSRIDTRIDQRLEAGLLTEITGLLQKYSWSSPGLAKTLAYSEFRDYFEKKADLPSTLSLWRTDEHHYARRQVTWFRHQHPEAKFVDISQPGSTSQISRLVDNWYTQS